MEPKIITTSLAKWESFLNFFRKNLYFFIFGLIIAIPVIVFVFIQIFPFKEQNKILCPAGKDLCKKGKDVIANNAYAGFGLTNITKGTPVFAAFDGKLLTSKMISPKGETFWVVYLLNTVEKKEAAYWFKGVEVKTRDVKKGDVIATVSAEPLNDYQGNRFIFTLMDSEGKPVMLKPEDFR